MRVTFTTKADQKFKPRLHAVYPEELELVARELLAVAQAVQEALGPLLEPRLLSGEPK